MSENFLDYFDRLEKENIARGWKDPTPEDLERKDFNAVWDIIKSWDINVPGIYQGYCGASGNHVMAILNALSPTP